jgi:hypothetical protein
MAAAALGIIVSPANPAYTGRKFDMVQCNLWIATLRNEDILWNKDTSSGPKLLFSVLIALWNENTSQSGTLLARPNGVLIS